MGEKNIQQWISIWDIISEMSESFSWIINISEKFFSTFMDGEKQTYFESLLDLQQKKELVQGNSEQNLFDINHFDSTFIEVFDINKEAKKEKKQDSSETDNFIIAPKTSSFIDSGINTVAELFLGDKDARVENDKKVFSTNHNVNFNTSYLQWNQVANSNNEYYGSFMEQFQQILDNNSSQEQEVAQEQVESKKHFFSPKGSAYTDIEQIMTEITRKLLEERMRSKKKVEKWR